MTMIEVSKFKTGLIQIHGWLETFFKYSVEFGSY